MLRFDDEQISMLTKIFRWGRGIMLGTYVAGKDSTLFIRARPLLTSLQVILGGS